MIRNRMVNININYILLGGFPRRGLGLAAIGFSLNRIRLSSSRLLMLKGRNRSTKTLLPVKLASTNSLKPLILRTISRKLSIRKTKPKHLNSQY